MPRRGDSGGKCGPCSVNSAPAIWRTTRVVRFPTPVSPSRRSDSDPGKTIDSSLGKRYTTTLRNEPTASPNIPDPEHKGEQHAQSLSNASMRMGAGSRKIDRVARRMYPPSGVSRENLHRQLLDHRGDREMTDLIQIRIDKKLAGTLPSPQRSGRVTHPRASVMATE